MKALTTEYAGVTFRSLLEADWAATLDGLTLEWTYEPQAFQLSDGSNYLPDFYLPGVRAWLEVKGAHQQRLAKAHVFAADLFVESQADDFTEDTAPLVLIGSEPRQNPGVHSLPPRTLSWMARGDGVNRSVVLAQCWRCARPTVMVMGAEVCRRCGWWDDPETWHARAMWAAPFLRAPRWRQPQVKR